MMIFKNSGDPLDLTHDRHCHRSDCTDEQVALTEGQVGPLRAGLHACALGDVYDWSFYGRVPTSYHPDRHSSHTLVWPDGRQETWPQSSLVTVTGLSWAEQLMLDRVISRLVKYGPEGQEREVVLSFLKTVATRPSHAPYVGYRSVWPERHHLQTVPPVDATNDEDFAGEKYLLHRWLLQPEKEQAWVMALPLWLVVTADRENQTAPRWRVVRDNICPHCGQAVTATDLEQLVDQTQPRPMPHSHCRDTWARHKWRPTLWGNERKG